LHRRRYESESVDSSTDRLAALGARPGGNKRKFDDVDLERASFGDNDNNNNAIWQQALGPELMGVDLSDLMTFDIL
jgi:hypothetical protein